MPVDLSLSLVSHTNVGKTTLARTLLGRDVGEVRDEAHVTESAEPQLMITSAEGDRLLLWDTPGFGDSQRLARRMAQAGSPLGWLLIEVWDRWRDRPFWASQRALRHVLAQADVALYLVNAAEAPEDAGYLAPELKLLALLDKPVIVLLNQLGEPGAPADEAPQLQRWQAHLAQLASRAEPARTPPLVLPLDAFTRCWVQEAVLLQAVAQALPGERQAAMARLALAWRQQQRGTFDAAMQLLADRLARAALDRQAVSAGGWREPLRQAGQRLGRLFGRAADGDDGPSSQAMAALAGRLDDDIRRSTTALIVLHHLQGDASGDVLDRLARHFARRAPLDEGRAALWGGLVTGALAGLKADLVSGGLTMGGGLLAGGVLGALGAAGAARGVNRIRGLDQPWLAWDAAVLDALLRAALLGYLAVAHHGRGRGEWRQGDAPPAWEAAVDAALAEHTAARQALWQRRDRLLAAAAVADDGLADELSALLHGLGASVLRRLYPEAAEQSGL